MDRDTPPIGVMYQDDLGAETAVAEFEAAVELTGVEVRAESHAPRGPFAGADWLLPTAIAVLIAEPYFDSFLREAGKDHYHVLKRALARLGSRFTGAEAPNLKRVYTQGKVASSEPEYSLLFSVYGQLTTQTRLKLLVKPDSSPEELQRATSAFMDALVALQEGSPSKVDVGGIEGAKPHGGTILVTLNEEVGKLCVVDPRNSIESGAQDDS